MTKHPTIEQTAHTKIMKLVMDYNAAGRTDVSRLADHILLTVKDSMDALDMRQERSTPSEQPKSEATMTDQAPRIEPGAKGRLHYDKEHATIVGSSREEFLTKRLAERGSEVNRLKNRLHDVAAILVEQAIKKPQDRINHALALMSIDPPPPGPQLSLVHIGILKDIFANKITLGEDTGGFLQYQIVELILMDGPALIEVDGSSVVLTAAGRALLAPVA